MFEAIDKAGKTGRVPGMKPVFSLSLLFLSASLLATAPVAPAQDDYPRREAAECRTREGIPNFLDKLKQGEKKELRIGYLGGSITAAPGWRVKSLKWFQERYPDSELSEINAAIGGTGSDLGVFRVEQDVLQHKPDLLFVEFAVNDGGAPPERIHQAMEGIVRQTWKANPETDIIFVYTLSQPFLEDLQDGAFSRSASAMEELADFYGIPSIHFGMEVAAMEKAGTLIFKGEKPKAEEKPAADAPIVFSTDGVHPLVETGHELYLQAIARSWEKLEDCIGSQEPKAHELGDPMREDNWTDAKLVPIQESMLSGGWEKLDSGENGNPIAVRFANRMPEMWKASEPGAKIAFQFRGNVANIYDLVGPDGGQLSVVVDGGEPKTIRRIDGYCTYHRLSKSSVAGGLDADAVHTVEITLSDEAPNKKEILFEKNRPDLEKNPAKYADNVWYAGSIMLIGDIVE